MKYFKFLYSSGIICLLLNNPENCIDNISLKNQKRQRLIAFILVNTMKYPRTLKNNIQYSSKQVPPPFLHLNTNPVLCHVLIHSFEKTHVLVVTVGIDLVVALEYTFFQLYSNDKEISIRLTRFRRSYVKRPAAVLTSHISYTAFLFDMRCAVQSGYVPNFCSCLSSMIVYLCNLFLFLLLECC